LNEAVEFGRSGVKLPKVAGLRVAAIELVAQRTENILVPIARGRGLGYLDGTNFTSEVEATSRARSALEALALLLTSI